MKKTFARVISGVMALVFVSACTFPAYAAEPSEVVNPLSTDGWELLEENTYIISPEGAKTAEDIAGFICAYLYFYGVNVVVRYIGSTYLTNMIEDSVNGTLNVKMYWSYITGQPIQYMYVWTFKAANSTETKGPFRYIESNQYTSIGEEVKVRK